MLLSEDSPFTPGTGTSPLHVAGRKDELSLIDQALDLIAEPLIQGRLSQSAMSPITIIGPRGVGKTTLLTCAANMARERKMPVVRCPQLRGEDKQAVMRGFVERMLSAYKECLNISNEADLPDNLAVGYDINLLPSTNYIRVLEAMLQEKPVVLLLDEVMHYDVDLLRMLLLENKQLIAERRPLAMIMAGTPALDARLSQTKVAFASRFQNLRFSLLSNEEACDALEIPLRQCGVKASDEAINLLVRETDHYPHFVQLAGEAAWQAKGKAREIDLEMAAKAHETMQKSRKKYYHRIYEDIREADLLHSASQVVAMVEAAAEPLMPEHVVAQLAKASQGITSKEANEIFNKLLDIGLVWCERRAGVTAAIPSFFTYFKERYLRLEASMEEVATE